MGADHIKILDIRSAVRRMDGNTELYRQLLSDFPQWSDGKMNDIRRAQVAGDLQEAQRSCHSLSGVAASIGANQVAETAKRLEKAFTSGEETSFAELLDRLQSSVGDVLGAVASLASEFKNPKAVSPVTNPDRKTLGRLLANLLPFLERNEFVAEERFQKIRQQFDDQTWPTELHEVETLIDNLDFSVAAEKVAEFLALSDEGNDTRTGSEPS